MVKITLLIRFSQIYSNKLPERSLSYFKILEFDDLGPYMRVFTVFIVIAFHSTK